MGRYLNEASLISTSFDELKKLCDQQSPLKNNLI